MADEGLGPIDLTGRWIGFYRHRSERTGTFPITAEVRQEQGRISGEMYDQITDRSDHLDAILAGDPERFTPEARRSWEAIARHFGGEKVVIESHLPDTSDIRGTVAGDRVEFTKSYRGTHQIRWSANGREVGSVTRRGHEVVYRGHLDREQGCIAGVWIIRRDNLLGKFLPPLDRGAFELYRKS